jgi:aminoglycoside phosphotransferase (APT) family kinase protein
MQWGELESVAACHVPGKGTLEIQRLSTGLVNETYRVLRDGSAHALRVAAASSRDLGLDRAWEARVLKSAGAADLAPALEYCDPQRGILIARWIDGRSWSPADVRLQSNIRRMAEFMRRIHALPMPEPARVMSPTAWIAHYRAAVRRSVPDSKAGAAPNATADTRAADALRTAATARLAALAALPGVDPVVCHSDLHPLNLVDRGVSLALLDWEYAHAADPLWDLAGWSANNDFDDGLTHDLLTRYAGRPPTHDECLRLRLLAWLYDYVCLLWSELYLNLHRAGAGARAGVRAAAMQSDPARDDIAARARQLAVRLDASK